MTRQLEARIEGRSPIQFEVADGATDDQIKEAAARAIHDRVAPDHDFQNDPIQYNLYEDTDPTREGYEQRLGVRSNGTIGSWSGGSSLFRSRIVPQAGDQPRATIDVPAGVELPADIRSGLQSLTITSDGQRGYTREEARTFIRSLERIFPKTPEGQEMLLRVVRGGTAHMGPLEGNANLQDVYNTAGLDPREFTNRTDAAYEPGGPNGTDPNAPDPIRQAFASGSTDTTEMDRRLRKIQALIAELEAKLRGCGIEPIDAYSQLMNFFAQTMNCIGGSALLKMSSQLQAKMEDYRSSSQRTADALGARDSRSHAGDVERGRSDQQMVLNDIQALQRIMAQVLDSMVEQSRKADEATSKRGQMISRQ